MKPDACIGFPAGGGVGHCIVNQSDTGIVYTVYLEIGDHTPGDNVEYPEADLKALEKDGSWYFSHKDGPLYKDLPDTTVLSNSVDTNRGLPSYSS
jgi:uncharacterized cupin superfamily protein